MKYIIPFILFLTTATIIAALTFGANFLQCAYVASKIDTPRNEASLVLHYIHFWLQEAGRANNGVYPEDLNKFISDKGYDINMAQSGEPFKEVDILSGGVLGEFSYVRIFENDVVVDYFLIGWENEGYQGVDIDADGTPDNVFAVIQPGKAEGEHDRDVLAEYLNR